MEWARKNGTTVTDNNIIECMDNWLMELWNSQVGKNDTVYILGDFSLATVECTRKILKRLNGRKFLITGNHDRSSRNLTDCFEQITQIKEVKFKDESGETFCFELCHFPMLSWNRKEFGTIHLHGHSHGVIDKVNNESNDLRADVGIDGSLVDYRLLTPDDILLHFYSRKRCRKRELSLCKRLGRLFLHLH